MSALAVLGLSAATAASQQQRPYRPAFDVSDYSIAIDLPDTGATIHAVATLSVARMAKADTLVLVARKRDGPRSA